MGRVEIIARSRVESREFIRRWIAPDKTVRKTCRQSGLGCGNDYIIQSTLKPPRFNAHRRANFLLCLCAALRSELHTRGFLECLSRGGHF